MIIINSPYDDAVKYVITVGVDDFCVYANNENEAVEVVANYFITSGNSDWYFDAIEVEVMAQSASKTTAEFISITDLRYCKKYKIYLPKLTVKEV